MSCGVPVELSFFACTSLWQQCRSHALRHSLGSQNHVTHKLFGLLLWRNTIGQAAPLKTSNTDSGLRGCSREPRLG